MSLSVRSAIWRWRRLIPTQYGDVTVISSACLLLACLCHLLSQYVRVLSCQSAPCRPGHVRGYFNKRFLLHSHTAALLCKCMRRRTRPSHSAIRIVTDTARLPHPNGLCNADCLHLVGRNGEKRGVGPGRLLFFLPFHQFHIKIGVSGLQRLPRNAGKRGKVEGLLVCFVKSSERILLLIYVFQLCPNIEQSQDEQLAYFSLPFTRVSIVVQQEEVSQRFVDCLRTSRHASNVRRAFFTLLPSFLLFFSTTLISIPLHLALLALAFSFFYPLQPFFAFLFLRTLIGWDARQRQLHLAFHQKFEALLWRRGVHLQEQTESELSVG
mmetsp:Transcript_20455/g.52499  ORF Transcript_20455/g.52499 Transcript_20455/m.52499 type:complete len:324 (-) Transcript_20455:1460-2431(-)